MKKMLLSTLTIALFAAGFTSCYNDNREDLYPAIQDCDTANVSYSAFIAPLMASSCATSGCHDAATASFAIILETYEDVKDVALNGKMLSSINHEGGSYPMPQDAPKLDDCTIAKVRSWINAGAPEN